jgi:transcriptional regulator with XRE-family HTH domain
MSQQSLALRLGVSRASVVNIEAGRQRPPLHVLYQIAEALGTETDALIPSRDELSAPRLSVLLDSHTLKEIKRASRGSHEVQAVVTNFIKSLNEETSTSVSEERRRR